MNRNGACLMVRILTESNVLSLLEYLDSHNGYKASSNLSFVAIIIRDGSVRIATSYWQDGFDSRQGK
jgi:hypothetical protein